MKKKSLKSIQLNKVSISNLNTTFGGGIGHVVTISDGNGICLPPGIIITVTNCLDCDTVSIQPSATTDALLTCNYD